MRASRLDYRRDVLPKLSCELVYGAHEWTQRAARRWGWRSRHCPLCGEGASSPGRLSCDPEGLAWKCHACGQGGDPAKWLNATEGLRFREAVARLAGMAGIAQKSPAGAPRAAGLAKPRLGAQERGHGPVRARNGGSRAGPGPKSRALALWRASAAADGTPSAAYVAGRRAWPVPLGWKCPPFVRWVAAERVRAVLAGWQLPEDAGGCVLFGYQTEAARIVAAKLEALTAEGGLTRPRWRRNVGRFGAARFDALGLPGGELHVAEGELTAIALAVRCRAEGRGAALAVGGSSSLAGDRCWDPEGRAVRIHADRDAAGRDAAWKLERALLADGRAARAEGLDAAGRDGLDALDELACAVRERAAIHEFDGGMDRAAAERAAWAAVVRERSEG